MEIFTSSYCEINEHKYFIYNVIPYVKLNPFKYYYCEQDKTMNVSQREIMDISDGDVNIFIILRAIRTESGH